MEIEIRMKDGTILWYHLPKGTVINAKQLAIIMQRAKEGRSGDLMVD